MSSKLLQKVIINSIQASPEGCITFADYLNLVLYHPQYGYYTSGTHQIGAAGDFFTSASLGADFGELLGQQFYQMWQVLEYPHPFILLEMGAGTGHLAYDILHYIEREYPQFFAAIAYLIIEESQKLIEKQKLILADKLNKVTWNIWSDLLDDSLIGCCFSNELVDAFPVHQIIIQQGQLQEVYVTFRQNQFTEVYNQLSRPDLQTYFNLIELNFPSSSYPEAYRTEVNLFALQWLQTVANKLKRGYLLTIDYGYDAQHYYHPQRYQGTLQCYYHHHRHSNPYIHIGKQDITTQVNFTALERQAILLDLDNLAFTKQGMFLMALGLGDRLEALRHSTDTLAQVLQHRDFLHQLINPAGLGNFGVLLQAKGLTPQQKQYSLNGFLVNNY